MKRPEGLKIDAYHEAAHVVATWILRRSLPREVKLFPSGGGMVKGQGFSDLEEANRNAHTEVVAFMAGPVAERRVTGTGEYRPQNLEEWGDCTLTEEIIQSAGIRMDLKMAERKAARLLQKHWPLVERLARALLERGSLSGAEVEELIRSQK